MNVKKIPIIIIPDFIFGWDFFENCLEKSIEMMGILNSNNPEIQSITTPVAIPLKGGPPVNRVNVSREKKRKNNKQKIPINILIILIYNFA